MKKKFAVVHSGSCFSDTLSIVTKEEYDHRFVRMDIVFETNDENECIDFYNKLMNNIK